MGVAAGFYIERDHQIFQKSEKIISPGTEGVLTPLRADWFRQHVIVQSEHVLNAAIKFKFVKNLSYSATVYFVLFSFIFNRRILYLIHGASNQNGEKNEPDSDKDRWYSYFVGYIHDFLWLTHAIRLVDSFKK